MNSALHHAFRLLLAVTLPLFAAFAEGDDDSVTLGAIASLTGEASRDGTNWLEGAQLAVEELGRQGQRVRLIVEDDGTNPNRVASSFVKLATVDKVHGIMGGTWDFLAETAYPLAAQYKVPFITPTNPVEIMSSAARSNHYVFTNGLPLSAEEKAIEQFLRHKQAKRIGLVFINVPYGTSHAELAKRSAGRLGIDVVFSSEITFQGRLDGIKLAALRAARTKPDLVFVVLNYEGLDHLLKEFQRAQISTTVLATHALKEAFDFGNSETRYRDTFGIFPLVSSESFERAFMQRYRRAPYGYAAAGYDAAMFMTEFVRKRSSAAIDTGALSYNGITGKHYLPTTDRAVVQTEAQVMHMVGGKLQRYGME